MKHAKLNFLVRLEKRSQMKLSVQIGSSLIRLAMASLSTIIRLRQVVNRNDAVNVKEALAGPGLITVT